MCARILHQCEYLQGGCERLGAWLAGDEMPPLEAFPGSLDVIADGPYAPRPRRRRVRVAVIRSR